MQRERVTAGAAMPVVTIAREHQRLFIEPECEGALDLLTTTRLVVADADGAGTRVERATERLWDRYGRFDPPSCPAGLEPALILLLRRAGYRVHRHICIDTIPVELPEPDLDAARTAETIDPTFLDFVRRQERGVVACDRRHVDPVILIAQAALAYPEASIAVVGTRLDDVIPAAKRLRGIVPGGVHWAHHDSCPAEVGRVVVATPYGLGHTQVGLDRRDILFALDAAEAVGERPYFVIESARRARLFAFRNRGRAVAPRDRDRMGAMFGFDQLVIPRHGHVERTVEVATTRIAGGPRLAPTPDDPELKRQGIWCHPVRNRRIARLARALVERDRSGLSGCHPVLCEHLDRRGAPTIIVLVEALEHALELADLLPGWSIVAGPDGFAGGLNDRQRAALDRGRSIDPDEQARAIVTLAGLPTIHVESLDVLVRADGGVGPLPCLASIPVPADVDTPPLLLVDCDDQHHPVLQFRSRRRRDGYARNGWEVNGVPAPTALDRFLAARLGSKP